MQASNEAPPSIMEIEDDEEEDSDTDSPSHFRKRSQAVKVDADAEFEYMAISAWIADMLEMRLAPPIERDTINQVCATALLEHLGREHGLLTFPLM